MSKFIRHKLKELRFVGGRFEENKGLLEFDVFDELKKYRAILVETAKAEWKRRNPGRERLPRGFEDGIRLAVSSIREGSTTADVVRVQEVPDLPLLPPGYEPEYKPDEVDAAAEILDDTVRAASLNQPYPESTPASIIPMFGDWGSTLRPDEGIELATGTSGTPVRFDASVRERIRTTKREPYEDTVDLVGEVRAAGLKQTEGGNFTVSLEDGTNVEGVFTPEQEETITEALYKHNAVRVHIRGRAEYGTDGKMHKILVVDEVEERAAGEEEEYDDSVPPIWETVSAMGRAVPEKDWENVPRDAAKNLHHYLYGSPKAEE